MVFSKIGFTRKIEKACSLTHIVVTVESVREFRETFKRKHMDKQEKKKKGKNEKSPFSPDSETDIPPSLEEYSKEIKDYFAGK